jgi:hypothetical protein
MLDLILMSASEIWNETTDALARLHQAAAVLKRDVELFSSVCLARLIVWRELRSGRRQEKVLLWRR